MLLNNTGKTLILIVPSANSTSALGDPLIKGLTEVANQRPENPIIFLANFLQNYGNDGGEKKNVN